MLYFYHRNLFLKPEHAEIISAAKAAPLTEAENKRRAFGVMFTLHALMNRAGIKHENAHTMTHMGYMKTANRF